MMMRNVRKDMKGSIRFIVGFLVVFGAVGGIENCTDSQLLTLLIIAAAGLGLMASGSGALRKVYQ